MELFNTPSANAADIDTELAVLPVGSTEQHGPHAPLGTDVLTARAVAEAGVEAFDESVVVAPVIPVGVAAEHRQFAGTLWVSEDTFRAYVRETIESLVSHGWERVVVVNGHGGNVGPLRELCGTITRQTTGYAVSFTWFDAIESDVEMGHGGPVETSVVWHCQPDLIDEDQFEAATAGGAEHWGDWQSSVNLAYDAVEFTESGVVGDPSEGSPALGEQLLEEAATALADLLEAVKTRELRD